MNTGLLSRLLARRAVVREHVRRRFPAAFWPVWSSVTWAVVIGGFVALGLSLLLVDVVPPRSLIYAYTTSLRASVRRYVRDHGRLPSSLDGLSGEDGKPPRTTDGWRRPILLRPEAGGLVSLVSLGGDGKPGGTGTDADLIGTFDPRAADDADWIRDPFGRPRRAGPTTTRTTRTAP